MRGSHTFQTSFQSAVQIHDFHVWTVHDMDLRGVFLRSVDNAMSFCFLRTLSINFGNTHSASFYQFIFC